MVALKDIAKALGVTPQRVTALVRQGMPTGSIEEAVAWREAKQIGTSAPIPAALDKLDDGTLASTITRHRHLVATAQGVWESAMAGGDPNQGRYQTAYNQSLKTLINLEEEQERRALNEKVFIKRELAEASVRELASLVLARLEKVGLECAEKCNPDNPALAIKTLDAWVRSVRLDLSKDE
jgi:plasmid maintenance system antidote protein VapI